MIFIIIVESNPDEFLVRLLGFTNIKHGGGKGKVLKKVRDNPGSIGIIDEDPDSNQPKERMDYVELHSDAKVRLLVNKNNSDLKVIQVSPRLEEWILYLARQNHINPIKYGLPNDANDLHSPHIIKNKNFREFMRAVVEKRDQEISLLRDWLEEADKKT